MESTLHFMIQFKMCWNVTLMTGERDDDGPCLAHSFSQGPLTHTWIAPSVVAASSHWSKLLTDLHHIIIA